MNRMRTISSRSSGIRILALASMFSVFGLVACSDDGTGLPGTGGSSGGKGGSAGKGGTGGE